MTLSVVWCDVRYVAFHCAKALSWFSDARDRSTKCYFVDSYHTEWAIVLTPTTVSSAKFVSVLSRFNLIEGEFSRIWECHEIQFHAFLTLVSSLSLFFIICSYSFLLYFLHSFFSKWKKNHQISPYRHMDQSILMCVDDRTQPFSVNKKLHSRQCDKRGKSAGILSLFFFFKHRKRKWKKWRCEHIIR